MHAPESAATAVACSLRAQCAAMPWAPARSACFNSTCSENRMPWCAAEEGESPQCERPQRENAFVHCLAPPTAEGHAVHLTRRAPSWSSARGLEKKIECVNFRTSGVSFSRCAFCFVSFARPANGEGKPSRNAALRAPTRTRASTAFRFLPSLLHPVVASC